MNKKTFQKGFTLIEVMIVVAIVGILAAIAVPQYNQYVLKGNRADAKIELLRLSQLQEKYFIQNLSYANSMNQLGLGAAATIYSENGHYSIGLTTPNGCTGTNATPCTSFTVQADAQNSQANDKAPCKTFTLANTGARAVEPGATADQIDKCWK